MLFLSWFVVGFLLHLQLIPLDATVGNRYFYFPFIGLLGLLGLFLQSIKLNKRYSTSVIVLGIILLTVLSVRTMIRNNDWRDQRTLISHDISLTKDDYIMEYLYGIELIKSNQEDNAIFHTKKAIELYPRSWNAWNNLGIIYSKKGNYNRAKDAYLHSMAIKRNLGAYENLALLFLQNERFEEADKFIDESLKLYPNSEKLWYYRILVGYKNKNYDEALIAAKRYYTLRRDKKSYDIYQQLLQNKNTSVPPNY